MPSITFWCRSLFPISFIIIFETIIIDVFDLTCRRRDNYNIIEFYHNIIVCIIIPHFSPKRQSYNTNHPAPLDLSWNA